VHALSPAAPVRGTKAGRFALATSADAWPRAPETRLGVEIRAALDAFEQARRPARRALVMGILNVTPDSFSDGGRYLAPEAAIRRGRELAAAGADWLDVGGESTRPGAANLPAETEIQRIVPILAALREQTECVLSVDTRKAAVARAAAAAGATVINDVSGLRHDPEVAAVAAETGCRLILMHSRGTPATMQSLTDYEDVVADSLRALRAAAAQAVATGVPKERLWIDPGFGFAKTAAQNLEILARLREYTAVGLPILVGLSRKSTLGALTGEADPEARDLATAAAGALAVERGAAAVRVHNARAGRDAVRIAEAVLRAGGSCAGQSGAS